MFLCLLHQLGQQHDLVEVAFDLNLALGDRDLRHQLAVDYIFDVGQRTGYDRVMVDVFIRHDGRNAVENFNVKNARYLSGEIELNGNLAFCSCEVGFAESDGRRPVNSKDL